MSLTHRLTPVYPRPNFSPISLNLNPNTRLQNHSELINHIQKNLDKTLPIFVINNNIPPLVAPSGHMIYRALVTNPQWSGHIFILPLPNTKVKT